MPVKTLSFAQSDRGKVRSSNQDSGYCGYHLFFVADGMGGHAGGDIASAMVAQNVAQIDNAFTDVEHARISLIAALISANEKLASTVKDHSELRGMGTTFSGLAVVGDQVVIAHIGDSRIYLVRDGKVMQISKDHTFVQRLLDLGRITEEEALVHPRRSVLMRVLGDVENGPEIDTLIMDALPGDRWLLCSDGLSGVIPERVMNDLLLSNARVDEVSELLVGETLEYGAYDNVTVVLVDIVSPQLETNFIPSATFVGSAASPIAFVRGAERKFLRIFNPKVLSSLLLHAPAEAEFAAESDEYLDYILSQTHRKIKTRKIRQTVLWSLVIVLGLASLGVGYEYTQTRFYVGEHLGKIAIYQGIRESLGPLKFSHLYLTTDYSVADLSLFNQDLLKATFPANDALDAERIVHTLVGDN